MIPYTKYSDKIESVLSRNGLGLLWSVLIIFAVSAVSHMNLKTVHHGNEFSLLSENPFDFSKTNDLQLRILSPLIGYLVFMRGPLFQYFMIVVLGVFFCTSYVFLRKRNFSVIESAIFTALLAFTTITFHQLFYPAYTDPGSFLLMILLMQYFRNPIASTTLLALLLLNHESNVAVFPFFFLLMCENKFDIKNMAKISLRFLLAFAPYLLYRSFVLSKFQPEYTLGYYFDDANIQFTREHVLPNLAFGIFQSFRLLWVIPLAAIVIDFKEKRFSEILLILSVIIGTAMLFIVAYDISRLMCLAFPAIIIGGIRMKEYFGNKFIYLVAGIFILNLFIPSYYVGALEPFKYGRGWLF